MELTTNAGSKTVIGLVCAVLSYLWGQVTTLLIVLTALMIIDYISGLVASFMQGQHFDRDKAIKGIIKKVFYVFLIAVVFLGDYVIYVLVEQFGVEIPINGMLGLAISVYLIGTEGFSCMQNLILIGLPIGDNSVFLKIFGLMKDSVGKIVKVENGGKTNE